VLNSYHCRLKVLPCHLIVPRYRFLVSGLLFLLCLSISVGGRGCEVAGTVPRLVVCDYTTGKVIVDFPIRCGDSFVMRYIHSVDHTPIFEQFRLDPEKGLVLEKTWFTMFSAGLGHWPGHGHLNQEGAWIMISDIERPIGNFILRIGALSVGHTIIYHDREINLSRLAAGTRVRVEFRPVAEKNAVS